MPLQKKVVSLVFDKGLNTKNDPKALPAMELVALENATRAKPPTWEKRKGCEKLGNTILGSTNTVSDADAVLVFNDELLECAKQSLYGYSESASGLIDKGPAVSVQVDSFDLTKNSYEQTLVDQAISGGIALVAWEDTRGGVRYTVYDVESRTQLASDLVANASAARPRCVAYGGYLYLFYHVSGTLYGRQINPVNPTPLGAEVTLTTDLNTAKPNFDVIAHDASILIGFNQQSTGQITLQRLSDALASLGTAAIVEAATNCLSLVRDSMSRTLTIWHNGSGMRAAIHNVGLGVIAAAATIDGAAGTVANATAYPLPDGSGWQVYYEYTAAATYNRFIRQVFISNAGAAGSSSVFLRSVGLAFKAFPKSPDTTNRGFVGIVYESTLQSTFFLARNDGFLVAKLRYGNAGGILSKPHLASTAARSADVCSAPLLTKNPIVSADDSTFLSFRGVSIAEFDFSNARSFQAEQLGDNLHISGGILSTYDGQSIVEHGFHLFPENIQLSQTTGGSLTLLGTYQYCVCYEWTDCKGQIHRSAPSVPQQIVLTGANNHVTLTVPTLRLTEKRGTRTDVTIVVYRTESLQSVFYQASSSTSPTYNSVSTDTVTIDDLLADASLISRATLYTAGGVLENIGAPSAALVCKHKRRLIVGPLEDGSALYSKLREDGSPVEFNDTLRIPFDRQGGVCTAFASMGDYFITFKQRSISVVTGDGPDNTGGNGLFSEPQEIANDIGAVDANSIAAIPAGIVFKSEKGFYLLGSDLSTVYIGAAVEKWNGLTATSAVVHADERELRIGTLEGPTLVYHYQEGQWSTFTNSASNDAVLWKGKYVHIKRLTGQPAATVIENDSYLDIDQRYSLALETGWFALAGIGGFQRLWRILALGEFKSAHKVKMTIWCDYSKAASEEHILNSADFLSLSAYGDASPYGSDPAYGGLAYPYLFRVKVAHQKTTAVKIRLEDVTQDEAPYESFSAMGIAFEAGVKKGAWKTHAAASV